MKLLQLIVSLAGKKSLLLVLKTEDADINPTNPNFYIRKI